MVAALVRQEDRVGGVPARERAVRPAGGDAALRVCGDVVVVVILVHGGLLYRFASKITLFALLLFNVTKWCAPVGYSAFTLIPIIVSDANQV